MSQEKRQLLVGVSELLTHGKQSKDKEEVDFREAEQFHQIDRIQMELEWIKKTSGCCNASEKRKLVDHERPDLSVSR